MKLFKPEDFEKYVSLLKQGHGDIPYISTPLASNIANEKLKEWLDAATVVYCDQDELHFSGVDEIGYTHKGYLIGVEEIKKECVKHEPEDGWFILSSPTKCKHCNAELVAEWKVI